MPRRRSGEPIKLGVKETIRTDTAGKWEAAARMKPYVPEAVRALRRAMRSDNMQAAVSAANSIIDRVYGRPVQVSEHTRYSANLYAHLSDAALLDLSNATRRELGLPPLEPLQLVNLKPEPTSPRPAEPRSAEQPAEHAAGCVSAAGAAEPVDPRRPDGLHQSVKQHPRRGLP